jgi:hypothetical protein
MKKFAILTLPTLVLLCLWACNKESQLDFQSLDDQSLVTSIAEDRSKQAVLPESLPESALIDIQTQDFDVYVESIAFVSGKGYEVTFSSEDQAYYNLRGRRLAHRLTRLLGPCGPLGGTMIPVDSLRPAILEYIAANYPAETILRAKRRGDKVVVLLSDQTILLFSPGGVIELNDRFWLDCRCASPDHLNVPDAVNTLIQTSFPGAEVKRICKRGDRIIVGVVTSDGRKILVFDQDWNFLFAHP